jgi:cyclic pyranopterin phosphate synthase
MKLSHINKDNRPGMVDVGSKPETSRTAHARAIVLFPKKILSAIQSKGFRTSKGPVFDTAIVAGVMAAKKTSELIPFCHPLRIDDCNIDIALADEEGELTIDCRVSATDRTGVEMEALTGASVAALTVYDMCKSLSHDIKIREIRLLEKSGGRSGNHVATE